MVEHGLTGRLWPIRRKPYDDESLSSWLVRLSRAYGADATRFYAQLWPHYRVWKRDLDPGMDDPFIWMLAVQTATSRRRIRATTVRGYKGYSPEALRGPERGPWLLHFAVRHSTRHKPWLQYCPHCLQSDADPYFRRSWRLAFVTVCPEHHRCLLDRCENCKAVINFHLLPSDAEAITLCHRCGYDMRRAQTQRIGEITDYHQHLLRVQTFLLEALRSGVCRLGHLTPIRSANFFGRLHTYMMRVLSVMHVPVFKTAFRESFGALFSATHLTCVRHPALERLEVEDRMLFMVLMSWWFKQEPEELAALCTEVERM